MLQKDGRCQEQTIYSIERMVYLVSSAVELCIVDTTWKAT